VGLWISSPACARPADTVLLHQLSHREVGIVCLHFRLQHSLAKPQAKPFGVPVLKVHLNGLWCAGMLPYCMELFQPLFVSVPVCDAGRSCWQSTPVLVPGCTSGVTRLQGYMMVAFSKGYLVSGCLHVVFVPPVQQLLGCPGGLC